MAAPREYEVREEYRNYTIPQLLEAPVTCFQGVGDTQSELLERYFNVTTVRELANLPSFLEAPSRCRKRCWKAARCWVSPCGRRPGTVR